MMRGMRYSPLPGSRSVNHCSVCVVCIAEFQAMLAMNSSSVSIGYGSPAQALRITVCSMPWIASGYCQLKAWSMRRGRPCASTSRSCGARG